jgi:hypothetical protein
MCDPWTLMEVVLLWAFIIFFIALMGVILYSFLKVVKDIFK